MAYTMLLSQKFTRSKNHVSPVWRHDGEQVLSGSLPVKFQNFRNMETVVRLRSIWLDKDENITGYRKCY